jgi:hypothetical protein
MTRSIALASDLALARLLLFQKLREHPEHRMDAVAMMVMVIQFGRFQEMSVRSILFDPLS